MFIRDKAKDYELGGGKPNPSLNARLIFSEQCRLCDRYIPNDKLILRRTENDRIICIPCLIEIASIDNKK